MSTQHRTSTRRIRRLAVVAVAATGLLTGLVPGLPTPVASADLGAAGGYVALTPYRVCDTRPGTVATVELNQCNAGEGEDADEAVGEKVAAAQSITVDVTLPGDYETDPPLVKVPADAASVVLSVAVTNPTTAGHLTVYPGSVDTVPTAANLNFLPGQSVPNLVHVQLGTGDDESLVKVFNSAGSSDVVVDVLGYTDPALTVGPGEYNPLTPQRICDTRTNVADNLCNDDVGPSGKMSADSHRDVKVLGVGGVPDSADVDAVVLNVAVTGTTAAGHLKVYPAGADEPSASNLNWVAGQTVPNRVIVPVGDDGEVTIYNSAGQTDLVIDVGGWYSAGGTDDGSVYTPATPERICDTRIHTDGSPVDDNQCNNEGTFTGLLGGPDSEVIDALVFDDAPEGATAVVLNVAVTGTTAASHLRVWDTGALPGISDLNWPAGRTISNLVVVKVAPNGTFKVYNNAGNTHVIVDIQGFYAET